MTQSIKAPLPVASDRAARMARRVSASAAGDVAAASGRKRTHAALTRQVSNDGLASLSTYDGKQDREETLANKENTASPARVGGGTSTPTDRESPVCCVSEAAAAAASTIVDMTMLASSVPLVPVVAVNARPQRYVNPLTINPRILRQHVKAVRLEAELFPMRLILSRLMAHTTHNRRGIFNEPVDPVALNLLDYHEVVKKPMDLGSIKQRLHAVAYSSRAAVANDIRLVFDNAILYNPPHNIVHASAVGMLEFFEDQVQSFVPDLHRASVPEGFGREPVLKRPNTSGKSLPDAPGGEHGLERSMSDESNNAMASDASTTVGSATIKTPQSTRRSSSVNELLPPTFMTDSRKRKKRGSKINPHHACQWCEGRTCGICGQGCLALEPTLLICNGPHCAGAKIRKGAPYFIAPDGSRQYCQRCHTGLPSVLPYTSSDYDVADEQKCRYKRDLLRRKNDEEVVEQWLTCSKCSRGVHKACAMHNEFVEDVSSFVCPGGCDVDFDDEMEEVPTFDCSEVSTKSTDDDMYTFVSGADLPVKLSDLLGKKPGAMEDALSAERLPESGISKFMQAKVRKCMRMHERTCAKADKTVSVRVISDCKRYFKVPDVIRKHFRMVDGDGAESSVPPLQVGYQSKAIALFQKVDGVDVCIFCMYVQEYDGQDDVYEESSAAAKKRIYVAYLDSVEHFRPRPCRTNVYHEMLLAYLATAKKRGFENAHIWACPPSRGNSFVFWNHPASQRTPNLDRLVAWYHGALSKAVDLGIIADVKSLFESSFQDFVAENDDGGANISHVASKTFDGLMACPPLLEGDFWIEEAVRIHSINMLRNLKSRSGDGVCSIPGPPPEEEAPGDCPARQVAAMLREHVIANPLCAPFRRPVNAASLNLADYHRIVARPMDLGTVYSRCILGEFKTLREFVDEVEVVFTNAQKFNPKGHFVHDQAEEVRSVFYCALNHLVESWTEASERKADWTRVAGTRLSLDEVLSGSVSLKPDRVQEEIDSVELEPTSGALKDASSVVSQERCCTSPALGQTDLLGGGPEAVQQRMVGEDTWLLEKRTQSASKPSNQGEKNARRRRILFCASDDSEPPAKRRRQSWLGEEVASSVRRMRASFFTCALSDDGPQGYVTCDAFFDYAEDFADDGPTTCSSGIADARHALLEFSQARNLEFDTLRHAKYSTAIVLYHLHHDDAPGTVPVCCGCNEEIEDVRWHKLGRVIERRRPGQFPPPAGVKRKNPTLFEPEELCSDCHAKHTNRNQFIPLQVSFKS